MNTNVSKMKKKSVPEMTEKSNDTIPLIEYGDLMDTKEVSEFLKINIDTLYKWVEKKIIPYYRITDKKILFNRKKLSSWLSSIEVNG